MAYLSRIIIYPVKALDGFSLASTGVLRSGALASDRRFAIFDARGRYVNGKQNQRIHLLRSTFDPESKVLKLRAGPGAAMRTFDIENQCNLLEEWLSEFFGFPVSFREDLRSGFPDDTVSPGPTLISLATLREVAKWFGLSIGQARARFRANLEIDAVPPFWEDQLFGERGTMVRFSIGDVRLDGINPCQRCVVPSRDPTTGVELSDFAKRFVELRRRFLPHWAEPSRFNHFYRLAVNTRLAHWDPGARLKVGDDVGVMGLLGTPEVVTANQAPPWTGQLRVVQVVDETPSVRTFRLAPVEGGALPFDYLPGQYLMLAIDVGGVRHRRSYTIASAPTRSGYCEITVKREAVGTVSQQLHDHVQCSDLLDIAAPGGRFTFSGAEAQRLTLIGAGVGITPLMSKIRFLTDQNWPGEIDLIYSARTKRDIVFHDELREIARRFPRLRLMITLTAEPDEAWAGHRGRISADRIAAAVTRTTGQRFHICGPADFADFVKSTLASLGVPSAQIQAEAFGGRLRKSTPAKSNSTTMTIFFRASERAIKSKVEQTILESADALGVAVDHGCLAGVCGRCKVRLASGEAQMQIEDGLCDNDKMNGYVLACQARPLSDLVVEA